MDTYVKMKKRRDHWKTLAVERSGVLRYKTSEIKRIKAQRNQFKQDLFDAQQQIKTLKKNTPKDQINNKVDLVFLVLQLFLVARIGFNAITRVLTVISPQLGLPKVPRTQTIINWVTRLSISRMKNDTSLIGTSLKQSLFPNGFILILDACIGLGKGKIMSVLALDARHHSSNKDAPKLRNIQCVAISVASTWTGETIAELLGKVIVKLGPPMGYLKDGGTDLAKAVRLLGEKGGNHVPIDDVSHFIANLLKHEYKKHPLFDVFTKACGEASKRFKQTLLACLAPPKVSTKARFMNFHRLVKWASLILKHSPKEKVKKDTLLYKLRHGLNKLPECQVLISDFLRDVEPLIACQKILKNEGLNQKTFDECQTLIKTIPNDYIRTQFSDWLDRHLAIASDLDLDNIGMPICSDSIESLFGVAKHHGTGTTKDANRIAQRIPALCGELTKQDAENVLSISVKEQKDIVSSTPSLTRQRLEVLGHVGCINKITCDDEKPNFELIYGSKAA